MLHVAASIEIRHASFRRSILWQHRSPTTVIDNHHRVPQQRPIIANAHANHFILDGEY
jgi:hypothetical protein